LSAQSVSLIVKESLARIGFDKDERGLFSGHSLRRGVMTESARAGASITDIMRLGRHKKPATAIAYIEPEEAPVNHPTKSLLK